MNTLINSLQGKTREEKLRVLNSLSYEIILKQKEERYCLIIKELSLAVEGGDLNESYKELNKAKSDYFARILDYQEEELINLPDNLKSKYELYKQIKIFLFKLLIVGVILMNAVVIGGSIVVNKITNIPWSGVTKKALQEVIEQFDSFNSASPEEKEKVLKQIRQSLTTISPIIQEIRSEIFTLQECCHEGEESINGTE